MMMTITIIIMTMTMKLQVDSVTSVSNARYPTLPQALLEYEKQQRQRIIIIMSKILFSKIMNKKTIYTIE